MSTKNTPAHVTPEQPYPGLTYGTTPGTPAWLRWLARDLTDDAPGLHRAAERIEELTKAGELLLAGYEGLGGDMGNNGPKAMRAAIDAARKEGN